MKYALSSLLKPRSIVLLLGLFGGCGRVEGERPRVLDGGLPPDTAADSAPVDLSGASIDAPATPDAPGPGDAGLPGTGNLASLADDWVELPTRFTPLPGITGAYQTRGWGTLRFNSQRNTLVFYEGFQEASRGNYCIYSNALYEVDPRDGNVAQRSLSNWFCDDGGGYRRLPNLPDTPVDRHTYAQFAYAPTTQSLYMVGGAAARFAVADQPWDFWRFSFAAGIWTKMPETYPGADQDRAGSRGAYEGNLFHHPPSDSLYYFQSAKQIHVFDLAHGTWSTLAEPAGQAAIQAVGAHGLYDSKRNRFAFYGNGWDANDVATTEFLFFDVATGSWQEISVPPAPAGPGPKSYASLEYNSKHDVYMLHRSWRTNDTWVFDPTGGTWRQLVTRSAPPPGGTGTYVAYDPFNDALIHFDESKGKLYALRYKP